MTFDGTVRKDGLIAGAPARSRERVRVNREVCRDMGNLLRSNRVPEDHEDISLAGFTPLEIGNFYLLLVAICHQTSPRGEAPLEGTIAQQHMRGWDYLSAKLERAVQTNLELLNPQRWVRITGRDVQEIFHDEVLGDRLSDPNGRAALINDLGKKMVQKSWENVQEMYTAAGGRIDSGSPSLLDLLANFRAYDDPVKKKSFFFLALMHNAGLWVYADPSRLGAPIDYHEVRGHLRIGTVQVCDSELYRKLIDGQEVTPDDDITIRQAVYDAVMFISEDSELRNASQLHYLFWNVFRSCCTRYMPHCHSCPSQCTLPDRYVPLTLANGEPRRCPFSRMCNSVDLEPKLLEHVVETDYY
jgi:hypothetical protein